MNISSQMITVNLPRYNYSQSYDRKTFLSDFPNSLISTAFTDPEEKEIDITQPSVTPYVLQYLQTLTEGTTPIVPFEDMTSAGRYLLIPILDVVSDPKYRDFRDTYPNTNLFIGPYTSIQILQYTITFTSTYDYREVFFYAIRNNYLSLLRYLLETNPSDKNEETNKKAYSSLPI